MYPSILFISSRLLLTLGLGLSLDFWNRETLLLYLPAINGMYSNIYVNSITEDLNIAIRIFICALNLDEGNGMYFSYSLSNASLLNPSGLFCLSFYTIVTGS